VLFLRIPTQASTTFKSPLPPGDDASYDFSIDEDGDGVPDQLAEALDEIAYLASLAPNDNAAEAQYRAALKRFAKRLPYPPNIRGKQQQLWALHERLMKAKDADKAKEIMADMDALRAEIYSDPNVAIAERVLRQRFLDGLPENDAEVVEETQRSVDAPQETNQVLWRIFLPMAASRFLTPVEPTELCAAGAPDFGVLQRGDLLFRALPNSHVNYYYAIKFSHVGMYDGVVAGQQRVYESNVEEANLGIPGGVHRINLNLWRGRDLCISLMRANVATIPQSQVRGALDWAQLTRYGTNGETSYNFNFFLKENDQCTADRTNCSLYCSQLIWQIFNRIGVDVDSNDAAYHDWLVGQYPVVDPDFVRDFVTRTVAPDEVARSGSLVRLSEGTNP
jgi:uncharacterized protein YycO